MNEANLFTTLVAAAGGVVPEGAPREASLRVSSIAESLSVKPDVQGARPACMSARDGEVARAAACPNGLHSPVVPRLPLMSAPLAQALALATAYAEAHETPWTRDPLREPERFGVHHEDPPPWNRLRGPVHARGPCA